VTLVRTVRSPQDALLRRIDRDERAYLLAWIACRGRIAADAITLTIPASARSDARRLSTLLGSRPGVAMRVAREHPGPGRIRVRSAELAADAARWLGVSLTRGNDQQELAFREPAFPGAGDALAAAFVRGAVDALGSVTPPVPPAREPVVTLPVRVATLRRRLRAALDVPSHDDGRALVWRGSDALDLLARLYERAAIHLGPAHDAYQAWAHWVPSLSGGPPPVFRFARLRPDAATPFQRRASDSGWDLTLVHRAHAVGAVTFYGTGLAVEPEYGWYFDLVPRSSIAKTGYAFANSLGIIDRNYRGELLVPLMRIDPAAPELVLPARIAQLVPRPIVHGRLEEVATLGETSRGARGFGSSG
jgi:deoxyuridine 5'-triphosphate nucleotidohydrolase